MDTKVTLQFNKQVIDDAKQFAANHNISLSRLTEFLLKRITTETYRSLEEFPIANWVNEIAEGQAEYKRRNRKQLKDEYLNNAR